MTQQDLMLRITGYSDKFSARPGETIKFHVNSEFSESYDTEIVRLIHGNTNPDGPGYKDEEIVKIMSKMINNGTSRQFLVRYNPQ